MGQDETRTLVFQPPPEEPKPDVGLVRKIAAPIVRTSTGMGGSMISSIGDLLGVVGLANAAGGALAGAGELGAEALEGSPLSWKRALAEGGLAAIPGKFLISAGRPLLSALKGAGIAELGNATRRAAEGQSPIPTTKDEILNDAMSAGFGGAVGGVFGKFTHAPEPPKVTPEQAVDRELQAFRNRTPPHIRKADEDQIERFHTEVPSTKPGPVNVEKRAVDIEKAQDKAATMVSKEKVATEKAQGAYNDEVAVKEKIDKALGNLEPQQPTVTETASAPVPGGKQTVVQKFTPPDPDAEPRDTGGWSEGGDEGGDTPISPAPAKGSGIRPFYADEGNARKAANILNKKAGSEQWAAEKQKNGSWKIVQKQAPTGGPEVQPPSGPPEAPPEPPVEPAGGVPKPPTPPAAPPAAPEGSTTLEASAAKQAAEPSPIQDVDLEGAEKTMDARVQAALAAAKQKVPLPPDFEAEIEANAAKQPPIGAPSPIEDLMKQAAPPPQEPPQEPPAAAAPVLARPKGPKGPKGGGVALTPEGQEKYKVAQEKFNKAVAAGPVLGPKDRRAPISQEGVIGERKGDLKAEPPQPPQEAAAAVTEQAAKVDANPNAADLEGAATGKEVANRVINKLTEHLQAAREREAQVGVNEKGERVVPPAPSKVTVEIPGDGTLTVLNDEAAIQEVIRRIEKPETEIPYINPRAKDSEGVLARKRDKQGAAFEDLVPGKKGAAPIVAKAPQAPPAATPPPAPVEPEPVTTAPAEAPKTVEPEAPVDDLAPWNALRAELKARGLKDKSIDLIFGTYGKGDPMPTADDIMPPPRAAAPIAPKAPEVVKAPEPVRPAAAPISQEAPPPLLDPKASPAVKNAYRRKYFSDTFNRKIDSLAEEYNKIPADTTDPAQLKAKRAIGADLAKWFRDGEAEFRARVAPKEVGGGRAKVAPPAEVPMEKPPVTTEPPKPAAAAPIAQPPAPPRPNEPTTTPHTDTRAQTSKAVAAAAAKRAAIRDAKAAEDARIKQASAAEDAATTKNLTEDLGDVANKSLDDIKNMTPEEKQNLLIRLMKEDEGSLDLGALKGGIKKFFGDERGEVDPVELWNNTKAKAKELAWKVPDWQRFSYLAKPGNLIANMVAGPYGSGFFGSLEHGLSHPELGPERFTAFKKFASPSGVRDWFKEFFDAQNRNRTIELLKNSQDVGRAGPTGNLEDFEWTPQSVAKHALSMPAIGMTAGDEATREMYRAAGVSEADARRYGLTSEPGKASSKGLMNTTRAIGNDGGRAWAMQMMFPFKRTLLNIMEQGIQRTPVVGALAKAFDQHPDEWRQVMVQQGIGSAVWIASEQLGEMTDPETAKTLRSFVSNAAGPYALVASGGFAAGQAVRSGKAQDWPAILYAHAVEGIKNTPLPTAQVFTDWARSLKDIGEGNPQDKPVTELLPRGMVPGFLREQ